jgi:branched-chain amino acid transport system substrate-binding protein
VLFDHSGPFSAAGSLNCWRGAKMMIDLVNERGGVLGKYKIVQVDGDSQSKAEVAINEAERLLNVEKVDILAGVYSSAHAVPLAEKVDRQKKFLWITTAIADGVLKDRNLQYTFRPQPNGGLFGAYSAQYIATYSQERFKKAPKDLRVAIIYEDGPYGAGVAAANEEEAKKQGMQVVLKEGYSIQAPDLSSLVTKLRAQRPDVLFHTGYAPDISLFLRQAKEQGLRVRAYLGHGAGHSQLDKLKEGFGNEVEGFHTVDPIASQLLDPKKLKPGVGDLTAEMVKRYKALYDKNAETRAIAPHVSMGFNNMWILLNDVLPRAIQKHGGFGPDALAKAARETDIPEGGTMQGYGVKFLPPGNPMAGQNERAFPAVFQVVEGKFELVFPKTVQTANPILPLAASSPFAAR